MATEKEVLQREVTARNVKSLNDHITFLQDQLINDQKTIAGQQSSISQLMERMNQLEQRLNVQMVQVTGLGPSVQS